MKQFFLVLLALIPLRLAGQEEGATPLTLVVSVTSTSTDSPIDSLEVASLAQGVVDSLAPRAVLQVVGKDLIAVRARGPQLRIGVEVYSGGELRVEQELLGVGGSPLGCRSLWISQPRPVESHVEAVRSLLVAGVECATELLRTPSNSQLQASFASLTPSSMTR